MIGAVLLVLGILGAAVLGTFVRYARKENATQAVELETQRRSQERHHVIRQTTADTQRIPKWNVVRRQAR